MVSYLVQRRALLEARERRLRADAGRRDRAGRIDEAVAGVLLAQGVLARAEQAAESARAQLGASVRALLVEVAPAEAVALCGLTAAQIRRLVRPADPSAAPNTLVLGGIPDREDRPGTPP